MIHELGRHRKECQDRNDLSLRSTCQLIAHETRGIVLKSNTVQVWTFDSEDIRTPAGHFDLLLKMIGAWKAEFLLRHDARTNGIDAAIYVYVEEHHPQFIHVVEALQGAGLLNNSAEFTSTELWKETPSRIRHFIESVSTMIAARPNFSNVVTQSPYFAEELEQPDPRLIMNIHHAAWSIPTEEDIATMRACLEPYSIDANPTCEAQYWDKEKYRFSAAATVIAFLNSISTETRLQIHRLVLNEDRMAVAWPECHGQGLITFCQENPNLHIERRVNLSHCILPAAMAPPYTVARNEHRIHDYVSAGYVSRGYPGRGGVADWIMEASRLPSLGLPPNSFTLVIDYCLTFSHTYTLTCHWTISEVWYTTISGERSSLFTA
jgi:hypothetical protein